MTAVALLAITLLIAFVGAGLDIKSRRIPNALCVALALASFASLVTGFGYDAVWGALGHSVIALVAGMTLFKLGMIGGGDAKFYAAAALGLPLDRALPMLLWTSIGGLLLLLALMLVFAVKRRFDGPRDKKGRVLLPYGVAIFVGLAITQTDQFAALLALT